MENIRITSGKFRGRGIKSPQKKFVHPMGSREKLALFNMISDRLPESKVLDAYAGSGALGIEAFSRGAKYVVFVEKNPQVAETIKANLESLEILNSASVINANVGKFLSDQKFDIVIADPPYDNFNATEIIQLANSIKDGGILVLSHPGEAPKIDGLKLIKTNKYARAHLSIYGCCIDGLVA